MGSLKLFPLNLVAYPTKVVPLHIFEERYKTLINDCISSDQEFGMVYSMDKGLASFGCSLSVSEIIKTYSNGEMDIITKGQRIFKIHSNKIENELNIGEVEYQKDKIEAIDDEFDNNELLEKKLSDNEYEFSARIEVDYINEKYKLQLPVGEEYETLGGLIVNSTEEIPKINEEIKVDNFLFKILDVTNTRINLVSLKIDA